MSLDSRPVVGPLHPDSVGNAFGFEGGTALKVDGRYYIFTTEVFDEPKTAAVRIARWTSGNGTDFRRSGVIAETNGDWADDTTYRMSPWAPSVVFDAETDRWHLFFVGYRRKPGSDQPFNMSGRIMHMQATVAGRHGIAGSFEERGWVPFLGPPDRWEGPAEIAGFGPFSVAGGWMAFYASNTVPAYVDPQSIPQLVNEVASTRFMVGLVQSASIQGPWKRLSHSNPVLLDPEFVENPVVTRVSPAGYIAVYDGANRHEISYSTSADGVTWGTEKLLHLGRTPPWLDTVRTPLGLIDEGGGVYTIYFTAFDGVNPERIEPLWHDGFGRIGRCQVVLSEH